jgi:tetratricopeptide (TPR) repeat protein
MPRILLRAIAATALAAAPAAAQPNAARDRWADSARREIEAAVPTGDRARLAGARLLLERALAAFPDDPLLQHYQGYALWREASLALGQEDTGRARLLLDQADDALERSAKRLALPETYALRSSVIGQLIGTSKNPLDGMRLGPKSSGLMDQAAEGDGARNPRVWLLKGMSAVHTPAMFGGGLDRAAAHLQRALELFAADRPAPPAPAWGHADAYVWLGQVEAKRGRRDAARAAYAQALALQPDNVWVRQVLLPALDRAQR